MLKLVNVDAENLSLSEHGEVDHSPFYNNDDSMYIGGSLTLPTSAGRFSWVIMSTRSQLLE